YPSSRIWRWVAAFTIPSSYPAGDNRDSTHQRGRIGPNWSPTPPVLKPAQSPSPPDQLRGHWCYRIGNYQAITKHYDETLVSFAMKVMHRSKSMEITDAMTTAALNACR